MNDQNNQSNNDPSSNGQSDDLQIAQAGQKIQMPCPNCKDRLYLTTPQHLILNLVDQGIVQLIARVEKVTCKGCGMMWTPALADNTQPMYGLLPVEKKKGQGLIEVPNMDFSKLRLT